MLTNSLPLYIQALAYWEPEEYNGPFSTEPCVPLTYSELEAYSEPWQRSIMENLIQNQSLDLISVETTLSWFIPSQKS